MSIIKNMLKKSRIYKFFNSTFTKMNNNIENNQILLNELLKNLEEMSKSVQMISNDVNQISIYLKNNMAKQSDINEKILPQLEQSNQILTTIDNKTKQFECINTELLMLKDTNKTKVLIVGFYGAPNTGDELMLQSILEKIDSSNNSITVMVADNPKYKVEDYKNINFIHYPKTNMDTNILANYFDKIIFGGGALIEDDYYTQVDSYKYNTATILINLCMAGIINQKQVYCIGLSTATELKNEEYINKLDFIINNAEHFSLRDKNSLETLKEAKIKSIDKVSVIDDLVYSLKHIDYNFEEVNNKSEFVIGIVLIGFADKNKLQNILMWTDEFSNKMQREVRIKLIPFYDFCNSDTVNLNNIINDLNINTKVEIVSYIQKYDELAKIFKECNLTINMRYHSSLISLKLGIPAVHVMYDIHKHYKNKMNYMRDEYNLSPLFISYENLNKDIFLNSLEYAITNIKEISMKEKDVAQEIEKRALEEHNQIINNVFK